MRMRLSIRMRNFIRGMDTYHKTSVNQLRTNNLPLGLVVLSRRIISDGARKKCWGRARAVKV